MFVRRKALAVCLGGALFAGTGVTLAMASDDKAESEISQAPQAAVAVERVIAENLGVFQRPRLDAEDLPTAAQREVLDPVLKDHPGVDISLAQRAETETGPVYLIPGRGTICQFGGGMIACGDSSQLKDPRGYALFRFSQHNPSATVNASGIVPDAVVGVSAVLEDGTKVAVPVRDNAYSSYIPTNSAKLVFEMDTDETLALDVPSEPSSK